MTRTANRVDLGDLVTDVVHQTSALASQRDVDLETDITDEGIAVAGDPVMIREAIVNLLNNAMVHGGDSLNKITTHVTRHEGQAVLTVEDNGVGIPPDKHFDATLRFGQLNNGPGSGLGLPIAARVASNHGGTLEILPRTNGTSVRITLPISQTQQ
jgi:two-component system sensor histidine kinase TctE